MANFTTTIAFGILKMTAFGEVVAATTRALNFASLNFLTLTSTLLTEASPP